MRKLSWILALMIVVSLIIPIAVPAMAASPVTQVSRPGIKDKKERAALIKMTSKLPSRIKKEILNLWFDYQTGRTKEARFVRQVGRLATLLQAIEYGKESKKRPYHS